MQLLEVRSSQVRRSADQQSELCPPPPAHPVPRPAAVTMAKEQVGERKHRPAAVETVARLV